MKKQILTGTLALVLCMLLVACSTAPAETTPPTATPASTTPAPTAPAATTPSDTTPASSAPSETDTYFTATLEGRILTLTGASGTVTKDFDQLRHVGYQPTTPSHSSTPSAHVTFTLGDATSAEALTVSREDLDGILEELFGVAPSANVQGPKIAVEAVSLNDIIALMNSVTEYREEASILFYWDQTDGSQGYPVVIFPNGRMAFGFDGAYYMTVRLDPTEPFFRDRHFYGLGHTVDREALREHLTWCSPYNAAQ